MTMTAATTHNRVSGSLQGHDGDHAQQKAQQHSEGPLARMIEEQTAKLPSDLFLWAALGSIGASLLLRMGGNRDDANFVGHWAPTFLIFGLYNKLVKVAGSDRQHAS